MDTVNSRLEFKLKLFIKFKIDIAESEFWLDAVDSATKLEPMKLSTGNYIEACIIN